MYGLKFKRQLDIYTIYHKNKNKEFQKELLCEIARRKPLTKRIYNLHEDLQKHIYIYAFKDFLRKEFVPEMAKVPMYYPYYQYIVKETQKTIIDNVHFLHLEYNTLPENKKWIMGCQCDFCLLEEQKEDKNDHYEKYINDEMYFLENISCTTIYNEINHWNLRSILYDYNFLTGESGASVRIFDPMCNRYISPEDNISVVRRRLKDKPLSFSEEI
jgi:hypothetical protein